MRRALVVAAAFSTLAPAAFGQTAPLGRVGPAELAAAFASAESDGLAAEELEQLPAISDNLYVFALQSLLAEQDLFDGEPDGILSRRTISAINSFCAGEGIEDTCRLGPLTMAAIAAVSTAITKERAEQTIAAGEPAEAVDSAPVVPNAPEAPAVAGADEVAVVADALETPVVTTADGLSLDEWQTRFGTSEIVDGRFRVTTDDQGLAARQFIRFPTEVGATYIVEAQAVPGTAAAAVFVSNTTNISGALLGSAPLDGSFRGEFVANADSAYLLLAALAEEPGRFADFADIEITLASD